VKDVHRQSDGGDTGTSSPSTASVDHSVAPEQVNNHLMTWTRLWSRFNTWVPFILPVAACLALILSSYELVREKQVANTEQRSERLRAIQDNVLTLAQMQGEYFRRIGEGRSWMEIYASDLRTRSIILLNDTANEINELVGEVNPSLLISFAYYMDLFGYSAEAKRYYKEVLNRLENEATENFRGQRDIAAAYVGLAMLHFTKKSENTDNLRQGRDYFQRATELYDGALSVESQAFLLDVLLAWIGFEEQAGDHMKVKELKERARSALSGFPSQDPRAIMYQDALSATRDNVLQNPFTIDGVWYVEFPGGFKRRGTASVIRTAPSGGWYVQIQIYQGKRVVEQWMGNGFALPPRDVLFSLQGIGLPAFSQDKSWVAQLRLSSNEDGSLDGDFGQVGREPARVVFRREN